MELSDIVFIETGNNLYMQRKKGRIVAATIKDIKEETGLSLATISKYLNGGKVLEKNAQLIRQAVEKLHYQPNEMARSLVTNRTRTVGVVCYSVASLFVGIMLKHVGDYLRSRGYGVLICDSDNDEKIQEDNIRFVINKKVDGIILIPVSAEGECLRIAKEAHIPVVLLDRDVRGEEHDAVLLDNYGSAGKLMECLIDGRHQKIALISSETYTSHTERNRAYLDALEREGIPVRKEYLCFGKHSMETGYCAMKKLLCLEDRPTAVFSTGYDFNLGVIMAINEEKVRCPEEISIVGFDDLILPSILQPQLTVMRQPMEEMGKAAASLLLKRIDGKRPEKPEQVILDGVLLRGNSVRTLKSPASKK